MSEIRIPLPQPFMVIPLDGSDPVHIHEKPPLPPGQPVLAVTLVTPYIAQKWLHAGEPEMHAVVMQDENRCIWVGESIVQMAAAGPEVATSAAVVRLGSTQAEVAWTAVVAMRQAFYLPESTDVDGLVLNATNGGQVLAGGSMLYDLRKPTVFVVLLVDSATPNDGRNN